MRSFWRMKMVFKCRREGIDFLDTAPEKVVNIVEVAASPEAIFKVFEDGSAWAKWFKGITDVTWTSPKPFGVGTTRNVSLGAMKVSEHFFIWEQNKRFSFYFTETNLPFVKALVEDYQLEIIDKNTTRFIYTVAYEPSLLLKLSGPIGKSALRKNFGGAAKSFAKYMARK
jgi:Polyketide cyclase / dehydrase and lipid transport